MSRLAWAREHLTSYLAGGLTTEERLEMQDQLRTDPELASSLEEMRGLDDKVRTLFLSARPPMALEDRVIQALRATPKGRRSTYGQPTNWVLVTAACGLILLIGMTALNTLGMNATKSFAVGSNLSGGTAPYAKDDSTFESEFDRSQSSNVDGESSRASVVDERKRLLGAHRDLSLSDPSLIGSVVINEKNMAKDFDQLSDAFDQKLSERYRGLKEEKGSPPNSTWDEQPAKVGKVYVSGNQIAPKDTLFRRNLSVVPKSNVNPPPSVENRTSGTPTFGFIAAPIVTQSPSPTSPPPSLPAPRGGASEKGMGGALEGLVGNIPSIAPNTFKPSDVFFARPAEKAQGGDGKLQGRSGATKESKALDDMAVKDSRKAPGEPSGDTAPVGKKLVEDASSKQENGELKLGDLTKSLNLETETLLAQGNPKTEPKATEPKQPETKPVASKRIIIRSGDMEFEVDSFDAAVGVIYKLIAQTAGGVVANTNSDKLPNGKMRGAVVVRIPPEQLDDFVLALRRELGKTGELKGQRIGSQDVTKHYTDMEGELRGLRVSEERLIVMLRETKGQLKDLLAVENQLAITRTKLEKMEGELRYYANLAAMSTLTIQLTEKEIRIAAGLIESERVQAGVESEDVDKSFQEAKAAIDELKGRVFRSELKQHTAGQFNAILEFDLAPESSGLMRDRLKQLGRVARLEIDRVQKTEGGGSASRESKVKRGDTQFFVSIYNLANVAPRETANLTVVSQDVPASYRKLRDLVAKLKGNLRNTSLQNADRQNVAAVLDFDIRRIDESVVQTALAEAGDFLSRKVDRLPEGDNVTDAKLMFKIRLISIGAIAPREVSNMMLAALDVPASYRKVRDAVVKLKGHIRNANLQENDQRNITATLEFDVLRTDETALQATLAEAGEILSRRVDRHAEGDNVTDAKVMFKVQMVSVAAIAPRETTTLSVASSDVSASYRKLRDVVTKAKGQVRNANLQENDRQNITASFDFDVLRADEDAITAALTEIGETLTRKVDRLPAGTNVTDAKVLYQVQLVSAKSIAPRESVLLGLEVVGVQGKLKIFQALVKEANGRVVDGPTVKLKASGRETAHVTYHVPLASAGMLIEEMKRAGEVRVNQEQKNPQAPDGKLALAQIEVIMDNADLLVPKDEGFWSQIRGGVSMSLRGLSNSAYWVIVAVLFVGPWLVLLAIVYWLTRRLWARPLETPAVATETPKA